MAIWKVAAKFLSDFSKAAQMCDAVGSEVYRRVRHEWLLTSLILPHVPVSWAS